VRGGGEKERDRLNQYNRWNLDKVNLSGWLLFHDTQVKTGKDCKANSLTMATSNYTLQTDAYPYDINLIAMMQSPHHN